MPIASNAKKYIISIVKEFDKEIIYKFNLDGEVNFWYQIIQNKFGKINT